MGILTYKGKNFYLDGKPYTIISGAMHYFRIPREYWRDRLLKLKECGFNTVETYSCWNLHEPKEGEFCFEGNLDIAEFFKIATEIGLNIIFRPGPYICAEFEFGGFPAWILKYDDMSLRCHNEKFLNILRPYFKELMDRIRPHLAVNGGNIFMMQIENEYGSYGDDKNYLRDIVDIYKENNAECLYFTADGATFTMLSGGSLDGYLSVATFGSKPKARLKILKEFAPDIPLMCAEFWCGWFDHWREEHHVRPFEEVIESINEFAELGASFNLYMFHGGTNFGFTNGANYDEGFYAPTVTSYDYNAPLNEAGDRTETYYRLRDIIREKYGNVPELTATEMPKKAYGKLELTEKADLFENLDNISSPIDVIEPKYMEQIGQNFGYVLYRAKMKGIKDPGNLQVETVHDRAIVYLNGEKYTVWERWKPEGFDSAPEISPSITRNGIDIDILLENMGRVNYGKKIRDRKGIQGVRYTYQHHFGWQMYPLEMNDLSGLVFSPAEKSCEMPTFLRGYLTINDTPSDTFLRLDSFTKGFVMVNGHNLGRYYTPAGPQKTLYVPAPFLKTGKNEIIVFESDGYTDNTIEFLNEPDLGRAMESVFEL